jgi:hypothetical protein
MANPFDHPARRIARAKKHIEDLHAAIQAFLESHPYMTVVDTDPDTGNKIHKVKLTQEMPGGLHDLAV